MREPDIRFLEDSFKKYYFEHSDLIRVPLRSMEREYGYQKFNSGMNRHISIKDDKELHLLFMQNIPSDVYCSNACYTFPNLPMNEKDWKEADLIFDIDAKDLDLPCRENHTVSICSDCNKTTKNSGSHCPECDSTKIEKKSLPCKICIDSSKKQVDNLKKILIADLGVNHKDIHVYFSGNEGFHVYVYNSQFQQIGSKERSDLVDYIMFNGAIPETFGMKKFKPKKEMFPNLDEKGWRGRFAKNAFGSKSHRMKMVSQLTKNPTTHYLSFQKMLVAASDEIGVKIDPNVTTDIHRIFRLPGSINSKSGLTKIHCDDLASFEPYSDACLLGDELVEISANSPVKFSLKNHKFGPYANETIAVPTYAAAYMICKKLATMA